MTPSRGERAAWGLIAASVLLAGACRTSPADATPAPTPTKPGADTTRIEPLDASLGHVLLVNAPLRFVVADFSLSQVPQSGDLLEVSRDGRVVGQLKAGYHARAQTLVADVIEGSPEVGDEVRPRRP